MYSNGCDLHKLEKYIFSSNDYNCMYPVKSNQGIRQWNYLGDGLNLSFGETTVCSVRGDCSVCRPLSWS